MGKSEEAAQRPNPAGKAIPRVSKDPVCGMEVNPQRGYSATHADKEYRFCSLSCLEKFQADPEAFVRP
jgi:Cu+-exporting ATPase